MSLKLKADPTFKASITIPMPGGKKSEPVEFEFKHRTVSELKAFQEQMAAGDTTDLAVIELVAVGWNLPAEFNSENLSTLIENYHGAARVIAHAYVQELMAVRSGN